MAKPKSPRKSKHSSTDITETSGNAGLKGVLSEPGAKTAGQTTPGELAANRASESNESLLKGMLALPGIVAAREAEQRRLQAAAMVEAMKAAKPKSQRRNVCPSCGKADGLVQRTRTKGSRKIQYIECQACGHDWNRPKPS